MVKEGHLIRSDVPSTASREHHPSDEKPSCVLIVFTCDRVQGFPSLVLSYSRLACSQRPIDARVSTTQRREQR